MALRQPTTDTRVADARPAPALARLLPIDVMRGVVMVLMAVDHSSEAFNAGRLFTDAIFVYPPGTPLPAAQFFTRWITHLCAPTFLFLAGTGLAFTVRKEQTRNAKPFQIDEYLLWRGILIAGFEAWISLFSCPPIDGFFKCCMRLARAICA
ncbi:MAG TPA: heparan-alpha-glucosaminide N-acetyltransferase domain-containing protein [Polyangiaceae bacterium]